MKRRIYLILVLVLLFSISGCHMKRQGIAEIIIKNYDEYSTLLSDRDIRTEVEVSEEKSGIYLNKDGKVLTIYSSDEKQYVFYQINQSNENYPEIRGDVCQIYWEGSREIDGSDVAYQVTMLIHFGMSGKTETWVGTDYSNDDSTKSGGAEAYYCNGIFAPDLKNASLTEQKKDRMVKWWVSAEELSEYHHQACEYYNELCSVLKN